MKTNSVTIAGTVPEWTISDRLRKARELTGLDQRDFARDIGVSRGTVRNYERGISTAPKRPILLAWAMRSGVSLDWLLDGPQEAPHPVEPDEGLEGVRRQGLEPRTRWFRGEAPVIELFPLLEAAS
jgi:transcriptional regulator with XRE-family HTH domain